MNPLNIMAHKDKDEHRRGRRKHGGGHGSKRRSKHHRKKGKKKRHRKRHRKRGQAAPQGLPAVPTLEQNQYWMLHGRLAALENQKLQQAGAPTAVIEKKMSRAEEVDLANRVIDEQSKKAHERDAQRAQQHLRQDPLAVQMYQGGDDQSVALDYSHQSHMIRSPPLTPGATHQRRQQFLQEDEQRSWAEVAEHQTREEQLELGGRRIKNTKQQAVLSKWYEHAMEKTQRRREEAALERGLQGHRDAARDGPAPTASQEKESRAGAVRALRGALAHHGFSAERTDSAVDRFNEAFTSP